MTAAANLLGRMAHYAAAASVVGVVDTALIERIAAAMLVHRWPPLRDAAARAYDPAWLIAAAAAPAALYDAGRIETLWQDTAGTVPVVASGDLVARMDDLNGAVHVLQSDPAKCPTYDATLGGRLVFSGAQCLSSTVNFDPAGSTSIHMIAGMRKLSDAAIGYALTLMTTTNLAQSGIAQLRAPGSIAASVMFLGRGTAQSPATATEVAAPTSVVVSGFSNIATPVTRIRVNGTQRAESTATLGTGTFMPHLVHIGARGGTLDFFNGHFHAGAIVAGAVPDAHRNAFEAWLMARAGVLL